VIKREAVAVAGAQGFTQENTISPNTEDGVVKFLGDTKDVEVVRVIPISKVYDGSTYGISPMLT